jgi:hypothetical protein
MSASMKASGSVEIESPLFFLLLKYEDIDRHDLWAADQVMSHIYWRLTDTEE